jgi:hypothetical protein
VGNIGFTLITIVMHTKWKIDPVHNKILKKLFAGIKKTKKYRILDAGS